MTWKDVKNLFRKEVGRINHVDLHTNEQGKSKGSAIVEFSSAKLAQEAIAKMNHFEVQGRKINVQETAKEKQCFPSGAGKAKGKCSKFT